MVIQGVTYLSDFEAKKAIMEMARRLEAKGWLVAGDGSMSVRVGPQAVWVTVAGADKVALTQDMLVRVDMNGKAMLSAKPKPLPEDLPIHLKIYQENENAQCVMHTYPACAAVMGMQGQTVQPAAFSPAVRALGRVQLLPAQNVDAQAQAVSLLCRTDKAVLLENDGCLTWGKTPAFAYEKSGVFAGAPIRVAYQAKRGIISGVTVDCPLLDGGLAAALLEGGRLDPERFSSVCLRVAPDRADELMDWLM